MNKIEAVTKLIKTLQTVELSSAAYVQAQLSANNLYLGLQEIRPLIKHELGIRCKCTDDGGNCDACQQYYQKEQ